MGNLGNLDSGLLDDVFERLAGALEEVLGEVFELRTREGLVEVGGAVLGEGEVRELNGGAGLRREFLLGLLRSFLEALLGDLVARHVDSGGLLEAGDQVVHNALVPVVSTEAVVTGGRANLNGREVVILAHFEQGHVERSATEVEDQDELVFLALVEAVGQSGCGGLVDDTKNVESGDLAGVLGRLALGVVEVRGNGDDGVGHGLSEVLLGVALELGEDTRGDLLRRVLLAVNVSGPVGTHVTLDRRNGAVDVGDVLALGGLTNQHLAILREGNNGGRRTKTLGVRDDGGFSTFENGDNRVGGSQVNSYCSSHMLCAPYKNTGVRT